MFQYMMELNRTDNTDHILCYDIIPICHYVIKTI